MHEEKIVEINGIKISNTGFKNLQFETTRTSDKIHTIRGFGGTMREENLNIIDTVSMDFILNYYELENLAFIYCLFKANGILPIKNDYLLDKIKSSYQRGKTEEEIKKDGFLKKDITHLICLLEKMSITSLEKTNNGYKVNLILTLYNNALTQDEYDKYIEKYNQWKVNTKFEDICTSNINKLIYELNEYSSLTMNIYNVETLNATYKEHVLNVSAINVKLKDENEYVNEQKAQQTAIKNRNKILENKKTLDISKLGEEIVIPNENILQIEFITHNNISAVPIIGSPIMNKSFLGIGETYFSAKLIFNEYDKDLLEKLKRISDKNIINHKITLKHPLIQLFDFHTSNIVNILFNNIEEANGIMVNIIFALNGFRYEEEAFNSDELLDSLTYTQDHKQEMIGGLYLEYLCDYLYTSKDQLNFLKLKPFLKTIIDSTIGDNNSNTINSNDDIDMFAYNYFFINLLSSYSSLPTCFGTHKVSDNELHVPKDNLFRLYRNQENEYLNILFNKQADLFRSDMNFFHFKYEKNQISDGDLYYFRDMDKADVYYSYIDNVCALTLIGNKEYRRKVNSCLYTAESNYQSYRFDEKTQTIKYKERVEYDPLYIFNSVVKNISIELFNTKQNLENDLYTNEVYKKVYEEFYFRLFYILNNKLSEKIDILREVSFVSSDQNSLRFNSIQQIISELSSDIFDEFKKTLYDEIFFERITREIIANKLTATEKNNTDILEKTKKVKENMKKFAIEFERKYKDNKKIISNRAYNIFLTKLNYLLVMYSCSIINVSTSANQERTNEFNIDDFIKIFILSSSVHSLLLLNTETRTDHFGNSIIVGMKNIGYKISAYNSKLKKENNENCMFYELFNNSNKNDFLYYKKQISYKDFLINYHIKIDDDLIPNKDINFFYGNKINVNRLYKELIDIIIPESLKQENKDIVFEIRNEIENFINDKEIDPYKSEKKTYYSYTDLNINNIHFPFLNFGFIPTHYTEKFYNEKQMNSIMKQRVLGNHDPFKNLLEISKIVFDNGNYVIPDYDILIFKPIYEKDSSGNLYKVLNEHAYMILKNASSISVVKNPKTKIKTAKIILNNTSKSIFNFSPINGSFDMKSLNNGEIDIIHVEQGDEVRIRLGYDDKSQIFNGFINSIESNGSVLILTCSSFASILYNNKIAEMTLSSNYLSLLGGIGGFFRSIFNKMKTTLTEISDEAYKNILNACNGSNPLNDHLFISFDKTNKESFNTFFRKNEKASMYSAFVLALSSLPTQLLSKFVKNKVSEISQSKLSKASYLKASLTQSLGSMSIGNESTGTTPDLYENLNNVDMDYETYGILSMIGETYYSSNSNVDNVAVNEDKEKTEFDKTSYEDHKILNSSNQSVETSSGLSGKGYSELPTVEAELNYNITRLPVDEKCNLITSLFKERRIKNNCYTVHNGIDICNPNPSNGELFKIYAVANGIVIAASKGVDAGNYIKIRHQVPGQEKYFVSAYMHLDKINVKKGDKVKAGDFIGVMGNTGRSSGTHLHFEMYIPNNLDVKVMLLNPFDKNGLPENDWDVDWNQVNVFADNGRYTDEWREAYSHSKKMKEYNGGR